MSGSPSNSLFDDSFLSEMLCSQSEIEEKLLDLKTMNSNYDSGSKADKLLDFLSSSIKNVPIETLDEKIISTVLSSAQKIFSEAMVTIQQTIDQKPKMAAEEIKNQLNVVLNLLKCWDLTMGHIKSLEKVSIFDIRSFPEGFFDVIVTTLNHCKTSAQNYGEYFEAASDLLTSLFRQCANTLNTFYSLMDSVIIFDTNLNKQMNILLKIIDETGKLAVLTSGMDAKTLTDMWKRFGKLASNYTLQMKSISPHTITGHFKGLSESIVAVLLSVGQKNHRSSNERSVLCCRLLLKILEKLCESYCGWIRKDTMIEIVILFTKLYRYTEQFLKVSDFNVDFIKFIVSNLTFMIDPFLEIVFKNDTFRLAFFEYGKSFEDNVAGYYLLLLAIMKKISSLPYERQREWCNNEYNVFESCFENIDNLTKNICLGKLQIQVTTDAAQKSYTTNIYEATCLSIFALLCQISGSDFSDFTMLLLKYLLRGKFFACLLSSDVWCFICRLGSSDLCYSHFKYLLGVYELLKDRKNNLNVVILANLIGRQYSFLSSNHKVDFYKNVIKSSDPHQWYSIALIMDKQKKQEFQQKIDTFDINTRISGDLKRLEDQPSVKHFFLLIQDLLFIQASGMVQDDDSVETFVKMWNKIVSIFSDCDDTPLLLLETLIMSLLRATSAEQTPSRYITSILKSITTLYPYASNGLRLESCRFLNRSSTFLTTEDSEHVADLFCHWFSDPEPFIQQEAFESFEHWTRTCSNSSILSSVALAIKNSHSDISKTLPTFISGQTTHQLVGFGSMEEFFSALLNLTDRINKVHICRERISLDRDNKVQKMDEDLEMQAQRICAEMESMMRMREHLKSDTCERLKQVCQNFLTEDDR